MGLHYPPSWWQTLGIQRGLFAYRKAPATCDFPATSFTCNVRLPALDPFVVVFDLLFLESALLVCVGDLFFCFHTYYPHFMAERIGWYVQVVSIFPTLVVAPGVPSGVVV